MRSLGLFDAKVPRYTSYPAAPHFNGAVDPGLFADWITRIPEESAISLYLHIPFCRRLCWFCACRTQGTQSLRPVAGYLDVLKAELALLKAHLPAGVTLSRLHWGGGTPTLLSPGMIDDLATSIRDVVPFGADTEFSVEIDPNEVDGPRLAALARAGMNRASIGVQDFNPDIQRTIGREQGYDLTRQVVDEIRARGIQSLNADILYGLPHQTKRRITESVQKLLSLSPDRVALYGYAHVPWMAKRQQLIPSDALPTPEERLELFETARRLFLWDGYEELGIDHFATQTDGLTRAQRSGQLRRNFQGYTDDTADVLIGLGASAISRFPQGYAQNASATGAYATAIGEGRFSTARGHLLSREDKIRGRIIEALMCDFTVDLSELQTRFDLSRATLLKMLTPTATKFVDHVELTPDALTILPRSRALTRIIVRNLDSYELDRAGHSSAI